MMFLLALVFSSATACISDKINLNPCWHRDILRVKGRVLITDCNFYEFVRPICLGNYSIRHFVPVVFLGRLVYLSAADYFSEEIN